MVKLYTTAFADLGDKIVIPDTSQPDGKMSNVDGWTSDYQLAKADPNYKPVGRQEMNGVLNEATAAIGEMQLFGCALWQATGKPYAQGALVRHNNKLWLSKIATNNDSPANGDSWLDISASYLNDKITSAMLAQEAGFDASVPMSQNAVTTFVDHQFGVLQLYVNYNFINNERVKQVTGTSESDLMSQKAISGQLLGVGQEVLDVSSERSRNTIYTAATRAIFVTVSTGAGGQLEVSNDGVNWVSLGQLGSSGDVEGISAIVPHLSMYRVTGSGAIGNWTETSQ